MQLAGVLSKIVFCEMFFFYVSRYTALSGLSILINIVLIAVIDRAAYHYPAVLIAQRQATTVKRYQFIYVMNIEPHFGD